MPDASGIWKCTVPVSSDVMSHTVSFVYKGTPDQKDAKTKFIDLIDTYTFTMGNDLTDTLTADDTQPGTGGSPRVEICHITDAKRTRLGIPFKPIGVNARGYPGTGGNSAADVLTTCLSLRLRGQTLSAPFKESKNTLTLVGGPDAVVKAGRYNGLVVVKKDTKAEINHQAAIVALLNKLTAPEANFGFMGVDQSVPLKIATAFGVGVGGEVVVNYVGHGLVDGEHVQMVGGVPKYRKDWPVRKITDDTFALVGSFAASTSDLPKLAKFRKSQNADGTNTLVFYKYQHNPDGWTGNVPIIRVTKRNPARKVVPVSFPRKGKKAK